MQEESEKAKTIRRLEISREGQEGKYGGGRRLALVI